MGSPLFKVDTAQVDWLFKTMDGANQMSKYWQKKALDAARYRLLQYIGSSSDALHELGIPATGMRLLPLTSGSPPASTPTTRYFGLSITFDNSMEDTVYLSPTFTLFMFRQMFPAPPEISVEMLKRRANVYPQTGAWATFTIQLIEPSSEGIPVDPEEDPVTLSFYSELPLVNIPFFPVLLVTFPLGAPHVDGSDSVTVPFVPDGWQSAPEEDNLITHIDVEFNEE
jgi:hypothetical protein